MSKCTDLQRYIYQRIQIGNITACADKGLAKIQGCAGKNCAVTVGLDIRLRTLLRNYLWLQRLFLGQYSQFFLPT